jgi:hypothetical protein
MNQKMNAIFTRRIMQYLILGLLILITACSPLVVVIQPTAQPTQVIQPTDTVVPTIQPPTATPLAATVTSVPPTATQPAVEQPAATPAPAITECQDAAQYITDDGLDGTTYPPNTPFTKTWTVKNTGTCTWDDSYLVSQLSGTPMSQQPAYLFVPQGQTVAPGQTVNISLGMTSPVGNGTYRSDWGLQKRDEPLMPVQGGVNGKAFYVKIRVNDGSAAAGRVTDASVKIEREEGSGAVCTADTTYFVHASITTDGPMTAAYQIFSSAGQIAAGNFESDQGVSPAVDGSLVFNQAGTKTIDLRFAGPYPYPDNISISLRVNGGEFYNTKLSCQ